MTDGIRVFEIDENGIREVDLDGDPAKVGTAIHETLDRIMGSEDGHNALIRFAADKVMKTVTELLMEYTLKNEDKMLKYIMTFDQSEADTVHTTIFKTVAMFVMEYTKKVAGSVSSFEEADALMVNARKDAMEFMDQMIDKRFAEVYP